MRDLAVGRKFETEGSKLELLGRLRVTQNFSVLFPFLNGLGQPLSICLLSAT